MSRTQPTTDTRGQHAPPPKASPLDVAIAQTDTRKRIIERASDLLGVAPDKVCGLLRNVWKPSKGQPEFTDQEMFTGLSMIARYQLDPISREIYVGRDNKGRLMTIIGIDGIIKILDRTEHYDGFEQEYFFDDKGEMEWCETRIFSKTRAHATTYRAYRKEYAKLGGFMATTIPWHMLRLFSLRHATRMFTPLGGVVTEEEAHWMSQASEPSKSAEPTTLDEVADRLEQPAKQPAEPDREPPGPKETTPAKPADTEVVDTYQTMITDARTLTGPEGLNAIETLATASCDAGDMTPKDYAVIHASIEAKKASIRGGRGAGSNKKDGAKS